MIFYVVDIIGIINVSVTNNSFYTKARQMPVWILGIQNKG